VARRIGTWLLAPVTYSLCAAAVASTSVSKAATLKVKARAQARVTAKVMFADVAAAAWKPASARQAAPGTAAPCDRNHP